jgi:hypothetical protein
MQGVGRSSIPRSSPPLLHLPSRALSDRWARGRPAHGGVHHAYHDMDDDMDDDMDGDMDGDMDDDSYARRQLCTATWTTTTATTASTTTSAMAVAASGSLRMVPACRLPRAPLSSRTAVFGRQRICSTGTEIMTDPTRPTREQQRAAHAGQES